MKKIICIFLSVVLIISVALFGVNASEFKTLNTIDLSKVIPLPEFDKYEENGATVYEFTDANGQKRTFFYMLTAQNTDGSEFSLLLNYRGSIYCGDTIHYSVFGDFALLARGDYLPGAYYILSDGKMAEINEAYKMGLFDSKQLYRELNNCKDIDGYWYKDNYLALVGDVNKDAIVSISDATDIQSAVAGLKSISNKISGDTNGDGEITVADATAVQKKIAMMDENYGYSSDSVISERIKIK